MPRRAAILTEADVTRAVKAARKGGAGAVEVRPDGTILILMTAPVTSEPSRETNLDALPLPVL